MPTDLMNLERQPVEQKVNATDLMLLALTDQTHEAATTTHSGRIPPASPAGPRIAAVMLLVVELADLWLGELGRAGRVEGDVDRVLVLVLHCRETDRADAQVVLGEDRGQEVDDRLVVHVELPHQSRRAQDQRTSVMERSADCSESVGYARRCLTRLINSLRTRVSY